MRVRDAVDTCQHCVADPGAHGVGDADEGDEEGQHPDVAEGGDERPFFEFFGEPACDENVDGEQHVAGNGEEIGLQHGVVHAAEDEREVVCDGLEGDPGG